MLWPYTHSSPLSSKRQFPSQQLQHSCVSFQILRYDNSLPVSNKPPVNPYKWANETVSLILWYLDYWVHTVNFKTTKQSFKSKKKLWNDLTECVIFKNTQKPIIEESIFLIVHCSENPAKLPSYQNGRHGNVLWPSILYGLWRKDVCICAEPIASSPNRNITFVQLIAKTASYVPPIPSVKLSAKKSYSEICGKIFSK